MLWRVNNLSPGGRLLFRKFRLKWPWEQARQQAVYNRTPEHIQVGARPHSNPHMRTVRLALGLGPTSLKYTPYK